MLKEARLFTFAIKVCAVLLMIGALVYKGQEAKEKYIYDAKTGKVTFPHLKHQELTNNDCKVCHHEVTEGNPAQTCSDCHKKIVQITPLGEAMPLSKAFHTKCIACHQKMVKEEKKAPVKCQECHIKEEIEIKPN
jgi:hypothetical protein